ncbi:MAG: hypothetical protein ABIG42_10655 [bacterium]
MIRTIGLMLSAMFILMVLGCGGGDKNFKPPVNTNPPKRPPVQKPEPAPEVVWLNETFGKYFEGDGLKEFAAKLPTMTAEEFEATLRGLGTEDDKPLEADITKAITFFNAWKEKEAKKTRQ